MSNFAEQWSKLRRELWTTELSSLSGIHRLLTRLLRISHLVIKGFRDDDLAVHAAALTFSTLMSLVPLLAIAFAVLKGLGAGPEATMRLTESVSSMPPQFQMFILEIIAMVDRTNFAAVGSVGLVVLFVTVVQVLGSIESSINRVWGVRESRSLLRKFTNYVSITVIVPVLIMAAFAVGATLHSEAFMARLGEAKFMYQALLRLTPLLTVSAAFFFLIVFMPNTHVNRGPAAISAFMAAILWISWQKIYISLQVSLGKYNAIYGTFASVPIFLMWMYVSWMIVMLATEIAFALQNHSTFHMERSASHASMHAKVMLAVALVLEAARRLTQENTRFQPAEFAQDRKVPIRLVNDIIALLVKGGLLAELAGHEGSYVLIKSPERLPVSDVLHLLTHDGSGLADLGLSSMDPAVSKVVADMDRAIDDSMGEVSFAKLLHSGS